MRVHVIDNEIIDCWVLDGSCGFPYKHFYSMRDAQVFLATQEQEREQARVRRPQRGLTREEFLRLVNMFYEMDASDFQ